MSPKSLSPAWTISLESQNLLTNHPLDIAIWMPSNCCKVSTSKMRYFTFSNLLRLPCLTQWSHRAYAWSALHLSAFPAARSKRRMTQIYSPVHLHRHNPPPGHRSRRHGGGGGETTAASLAPPAVRILLSSQKELLKIRVGRAPLT